MAQIITFLKIIQDGILPHQQTESITTTNLLFRLHTKYSSTALIITGTLLYIQQFFVDHLKCIRPAPEGTVLESQPLNQYCYTTGTYSTRNESSTLFGSGNEVESVTYFHQYFQWVPFILILQGMVFHVPQLLWNKLVERGRLASFCAISPKEDDKGEEKEPEDKVDGTPTKDGATQTPPLTNPSNITPFAMTLGSTRNKTYFYGFVACEIVNLCVVIISVLTTEWFLGGRFLSLGPRWIVYLHRLRSGPITSDKANAEYAYNEQVESGNPLEGAFPTLFTCHWRKPMSDLYYDVPCILGQNVTHQRLYLLLWISAILLVILGIGNLIYRVCTLNSPRIRAKLLERHLVKKGFRSPSDLHTVLCRIPVHDWFILQRILRNVDCQKFDVILHQVKDALNNDTALLDKGSRKRSHTVAIELQPVVSGT